MQCPQCGGEMTEELHGVTLDHCSSCGGIWFDADELQSVVRRPATAQIVQDPLKENPPIEGAALHCPRCQASSLLVHKVRGALVHSCSECRGLFVGSQAVLKILDRSSFGAGDVALDVLLCAPELPAAAAKEILEVLGDILTGW